MKALEAVAQGTVVLCLEASRSALLPIFLEYSFLQLYLVNPKSMARFREVVSPAAQRPLDCELACQLVKNRGNCFIPLWPRTR